MTKRIWGIILALSLVMSCLVSSVSAENEADGGAAVSDAFQTLSERSADKLLAFEVFDKKTEADIVTRSGFVTYLLKLMNHESIGAESQVSAFDDVESNIADLNEAKALGIISGSDGNFFPEQAITGIDAAVMLIRCLGYTAAVDQSNGYPLGYTKLAGELRLFQGAAVTDVNEALTYEQIAVIFQNALNTKLMYRDVDGKYMRAKDVTALNYYHKIFRARDIVKANDRTNLTGAAGLADNSVMIGDTVYDAGQSGVDGYLGYKVDYYYFDDGKGDFPVVKYAQQDSSTKLLVIDAEDVEGLDDANRLNYYDKGRQKSAVIPSGMQVVFNNALSIKIDKEDFKPESGELKFVDNNGDGRYDVLFIQSYRTVVVKNVFAEDERIQDYISGEFVELSEYDEWKMTAKGVESEIADLKKWDVLSIAGSKEKEYAEIVIGHDKVSGKIEKISDEVIKIGGKEYPLSPYLKKLVRGGTIKFVVGDALTIYLNFQGEAAICDTSAIAGRYGVITGMSESFFGDTCDVLLLDREDGKRKLTTAKNVSIDGESYRNANIGTKLREIMSAPYYGVVPVLYETNADNQLTKLETPNGQRLKALCTNENYYYVWEANTFLKNRLNGSFFAGSSTFFCYVPENPHNLEDYTIRTLQDIISDIDKNIYAFAVDDSRIADFVLIKSDSSQSLSVGAGESLAVVADKLTGLDEDGIPIDMLVVYKNGVEIEIPLKNQEDADKVEKGDIIFYSPNVKGELEGIAEIYRGGSSGVFANCVQEKGRVAGKVHYREGNIIGLVTDEEQPEQLIYCNLFAGPNIYVYDTKTEKVSVGTTEDIIDYASAGEAASTVFVQTNYTKVKNVVVYK